VAARAGFADTFGDLAAGELDELRTDFLRKAVLAQTHRVCAPLLTAGGDLTGMRLGDLRASPELDRLRARRIEVGLPADDDAPLLVDVATGEPVPPDHQRLHLGRARLSRVNIEANSGICRGMLHHRYAQTEEEQ
jgi:hypothetical protein